MGWDGHSDDDNDNDNDGSGGGSGTLALDVINHRVWPNGPTRSGDDDDDGIGSPCHRGCAGHVYQCALDVRDVVGAAHRGSPQFNANPPVPAGYGCRCAPVIRTGTVCTGTGAVSGNQTCGIPVLYLIKEEDFATILIGSLPKTYDMYLSAIMATMNVLRRALDPDALLQCVGDEYDRRAIANGGGKSKNQDVALYAGDRSARGGKGKRSDVECFNCHKKGHTKADCRAKGGGKEGQGPKSQKLKKIESANATKDDDDDDGIWNAYLDSDAESNGSYEDDLFEETGVNAEIWGWEDDDLPDLIDLSGSDSHSEEEHDRETKHNADKGPIEVDSGIEVVEAQMATGTGVMTEWDLYNSGASKHMSAQRNEFINYTPTEPKPIRAADKRTFNAIGKGDLRVDVPNRTRSSTIVLKNVLHCPSVGPTLISISKIAAAGATVVFKGTSCKIFNPRNQKVGEIEVQNGLYKVAHQSNEHAGAVGEVTISLEEMHRQMGHVAPSSIERMVAEKAFEGPSIDDNTDLKFCESCEYGKAMRKPITSVRQSHRATKFGEEIHSDLWGPSPVRTPGQKEYYISFTDDYSRWTRIYLLRLKSNAFKAYQQFEAWVKMQHGIKAVKKLRSDRGGECLGEKFDEHLANNGTTRILTTHDTLDHNGVAERLYRTLLEQTHTIIHASRLPKFLWGEAVNHVIWLKNRTITNTLPPGKTQFELLHNMKPDLSGLHENTGTKLDG